MSVGRCTEVAAAPHGLVIASEDITDACSRWEQASSLLVNTGLPSVRQFMGTWRAGTVGRGIKRVNRECFALLVVY